MRSRVGLSGASVLFLLALVAACGAPRTPAGPGAELGIEVLGVELMADGDLARLNYRVTDFEKARKAMDGEIGLYPGGLDQAMPITNVGRLGPMRQRPNRTGLRQFVLFTNTGRLLKKGGTATLRVGNGRIEGIPII